MQRIDIFPISVWVESLSVDKKQLLDDIQKIKEEDSGVSKSNFGGYQSNEDAIFKLPYLQKEITESFQKILPDLKLQCGWININKKGDHNYQHVHPGSILSCAYYVTDPKECFNISDPNLARIMNENSQELFRPKLKEGDIIIFPSWLPHYVSANPNDDERISISCNYGF